MSTRSWRCNEKIGACEQSPLTQNITTIQTTHGQRGAFPSSARDCTFLCAIKKVRYNNRREEILVNTFPFLFTLTSVSQCTGTIWQTGRIKIWQMRRELLDKKCPLYGGRISRVPPLLMLCSNTMSRYLLSLQKDKTFFASTEFQSTCLVLLLKTILKNWNCFLSCVTKD